jgi:hypothetical protein
VLDASGTQAVRRVEVRLKHKSVWIRLATTAGAHLDLRGLRRSAKYFEREFGISVHFGRVRRAPAVANERLSSEGTIRRSPTVMQKRSAA